MFNQESLDSFWLRKRRPQQCTTALLTVRPRLLAGLTAKFVSPGRRVGSAECANHQAPVLRRPEL
jgi:hypothetical protein